MNTLKKLIALFLVVSTIGFLPSCTNALYKQDNYTENVSHVLISEDKKTLAVIGQEHHYIFDLPSTLSTAILSPLHDSVSGHIRPFHVEPDGDIYGEITLSINKEASEDVKKKALVAGFKENKNGTLRYRIDLEGTCYVAGNFRIPETVEALNETHEVRVYIEHSAGRKTMNYLLTPLAVAGDGALILSVTGVFMAMFIVTIPIYGGEHIALQ